MTSQEYKAGANNRNAGVDRDNQRKWLCLDADGIIVGYLLGETAVKAIEEFMSRRASPDPFRKPVCTLVSGSIRLNVEDLDAN